MTNNPYAFEFCPKIAVFDGANVLLCRRVGEADYDGVFSFIGGKMEHRDTTIVDGLHREKTEEIGPDTRLSVLTRWSIAVEFNKANGARMILPHYLADWQGGTIALGDEYSEYRWVPTTAIAELPNTIPNIAEICAQLDRLRHIAGPDDYQTI